MISDVTLQTHILNWKFACRTLLFPPPPFQPKTDGYMIIIDPVLYNIVPVYNDTQTLKNIRSSLGYNFVINQDKTESLQVKKDRL